MKQTIISLAIILVATAVCFGLIHERNRRQAALITMCPKDVMMCPDGTSVPRSGPSCEFGICRQETAQYLREGIPPITHTPTLSLSSSTMMTKKITINTIVSPVVSLFEQVVKNLSKSVPLGTKEFPEKEATPQNNQTPTQPGINETRYSVKDNNVIDQNNTVIYTLPTASSNSSGNNTDTHLVNVVPINNIAPVIGAVPVEGLPGKYYLSENYFASTGGCEFANKIYILDTKNNSLTLLYEENNKTIPADDPRACNSEMYLLATENEKLILKYHTIGTNMTCDSTWSEPEKTWYLDVTHTEKKTSRYWISPALSSQAEVSESLCRKELVATTTP